tara:strand:- start:9641 stop:10138 length:498 start_codon:yes stop_codon:yes gene_type:complete
MDQMTPQGKAAVMQLMGQTYGQMKKQDEMIVGASAQLQGKSSEMKDLVEQLVSIPTVDSQYQPAPQGPPPQSAPEPQHAPIPKGPPTAPITPEQAQLELQQAAAPVDPAPVIQETMEFDFREPTQMEQLLDAVKESNLLLKDIKLQLESSNVRPKRKSAKAKVTD